MAFTPISNDFIQHSADASGTSASGYYLKLYAAGTNTPISVALDSAGNVLVGKVELDSLGYAKNASGGATTLYVDQSYRLVLFVNAADADANTFTSAIQDIDDIPQIATTDDAAAIEAKVTAITNVTVNYDFVLGMKEETAPIAERVVKLKDYSLGADAGALTFITKATTGTDDGGAIINHASLAFRYEQIFNESIDASQFGVAASGDVTTEFKKFITYITTNKLKGTITAAERDYSANLLSTSDNIELHLSCLTGEAVFNYTGSEITRTLFATDADIVDIRRLRFELNDLCAAGIDLRRSASFGGFVECFNCTVNGAKQTALATNPVGIRFEGAFSNVRLVSPKVNGVTYTTTGRAAAGIGLVGMAGTVSVVSPQISNISTNGTADKDADGLVIFGSDVATLTTFLGARAEVHNGVFSDCEGRFIKMQISDYEIHGNQFKLSSGFTTITEWRGIDVQANNGDIHSNTFRFGTGVTFGGSASLYTVQNIRNDSGNKTTHIYKNRCTSASDIRFMFSLLSDFGTNTYVLDDNDFIGAAVTTMCTHRVTTLATTDKINIYVRQNKVTQIYNELFDPFDDVDFGDKLYLEITDNENFQLNNISVYDEAKTVFSASHHFRVKNNAGIKPRVNWVFDMDDLPDGNAFYTGGQAVLNLEATIAPGTFIFINTDGFAQRTIPSPGTLEYRRVTFSTTTWKAWVAV